MQILKHYREEAQEKKIPFPQKRMTRILKWGLLITNLSGLSQTIADLKQVNRMRDGWETETDFAAYQVEIGLRHRWSN